MLWLFIIVYVAIAFFFFYEQDKGNLDYEDLSIGTYFVMIGGGVLAGYPFLSGKYGSYGNFEFVAVIAAIIGIIGLLVGVIFYLTEFKDEKELHETRKNRSLGGGSLMRPSGSNGFFSAGTSHSAPSCKSSFKTGTTSRKSSVSSPADDCMTARDCISWDVEQRIAEHDDMIESGHSTVNLEPIVNNDGSYDMDAVERNISSMENDYNSE